MYHVSPKVMDGTVRIVERALDKFTGIMLCNCTE
jgi:hypothetical protein